VLLAAERAIKIPEAAGRRLRDREGFGAQLPGFGDPEPSGGAVQRSFHLGGREGDRTQPDPGRVEHGVRNRAWDRINKAAAAKVGASLVARKLMREIRAKPEMPVWRTDDDGRLISLVITRAGRDAIGVKVDSDEAQPPVEISKPCSAIAAIEGRRTAGLPRSGSKQALLVTMLAKDKGASLAAIVEATGWLPHTTRAASTGLRKRGFAIERTSHEKLVSAHPMPSLRRPRIE
jgi:hypothetical protein